MFEIIDHTADIGIAAYGKDLKEAFSTAAYAMFNIIAELDTVEEHTCYPVEVSASDTKNLLVAWLNELLYFSDVEYMLFKKFEILHLDDTTLKAHVYGEKIDLTRHQMKTPVKAATYHMLELQNGAMTREKQEYNYRIQVLLDI